MKKFLNIIGISCMILMATMLNNKAEAQMRAGINISFQTFYDELSPYGDWIDYPEYGYTWRPRVGADFRPYSTNGRWVYADSYDWMWASDYNWGWAPFHYGRWFYDDFYGWMWVPGYDWSPAWVAWRGGGDYYGWAPIQPGFSISLGFGSYYPPDMYWNFVPGRYMSYNNIGRYCSPWRNNVTIIHNTTIINNYGRRNNYYVNGPDRRAVERYTGRIKSVNVRDVNTPNNRGALRRNDYSLYRPTVDRSARGANNGMAVSPRTVKPYDGNSRNGNVGVGRNNSGINRGNTVGRGAGTSGNGVVSGDVRNGNAGRGGIDGNNNSRVQNNRNFENRTDVGTGRNSSVNRNQPDAVYPNTNTQQNNRMGNVTPSRQDNRRVMTDNSGNGNMNRQNPVVNQPREQRSGTNAPQVQQPRMEQRRSAPVERPVNVERPAAPQRTMESRPARVESMPPQRSAESRNSKVESMPPQRSMGDRSGSRSENSSGERRGRF